ncbi:Hpt domain-containing protein [Winogradskyella poriferorum]|uniref:Hpt domain-containing protein n=1 Tax=Winogradskyella poriferorum TaxID=307627 RepID=UPI003D64B1C1
MEQPNLSYIKSMSGGDKDFEQKLIGIIQKELPQEKAIYFKNIADNNFREAAANVHKLKHKISILGLVNSYESAVKYEHNLLEGSKEGQVNFDATLENMTNFLKTL